MKKYLPHIIIGILVILIIIALLKRKQVKDGVKAVVESEGGTIESGQSIQDVQFPVKPQMTFEEMLTPTPPPTVMDTPTAIPGNLPGAPGCINNTAVVALIEEWKTLKLAKKKAIRRGIIKLQLTEVCPDALKYLVV